MINKLFFIMDHFDRIPSEYGEDFYGLECIHCHRIGNVDRACTHGEIKSILKEHLDLCPGFKLWQKQEAKRIQKGGDKK